MNMIDFENLGIAVNQPLYLYRDPMFMLTVSTVVVVGNGVYVVKMPNEPRYKFPGGRVRAGQETIQFACVRYVKEQLGIALSKELLIPVDFRSDPERSQEKNVVDIGMLVILDEEPLEINSARMEIDFESRALIDDKVEFYMDHDTLLHRAIDVVLMMRES
jgi:ADP-ribose pyrophosphatase YjhB (NUDIX family)